MAHLHAIVQGTVQGVGFRAYAQVHALMLDLVGWVKNLPDGTVETQAIGSQAALEAYLDRLRRGPTGATVRDVTFTITQDDPPAVADLPYPFQIRYHSTT